MGLELRLFFRERQQVVFSFAYPVVMMVVFGSVLGGDVLPGGVPFPQYFLAGIAATGIMLSSFQAIGTSIASERENGQLERLQLLGTPAVAYFAGKAGQVLVDHRRSAGDPAAGGALRLRRPLPSRAVEVADVRLGRGARLPGRHGARDRRLGAAGDRGVGRHRASPGSPSSCSSSPGCSSPSPSCPRGCSRWPRCFPLKWLTQGMRSVFLPDEAASAEVAGSWEHGRIALVLVAWVIIGVVVCVRTFRWRRADG